MYESMDDKSIKCKFCNFEGEFKYEWTQGSFFAVCPSCKKVNYRVKKEKIDALVNDIIAGSLGDLGKKD